VKVLYRLHKAGYQAHLVGGGVRDLLLGNKPKDFDIATDAHPDEVKSLFTNCRLIGRRFRLAHVHFGREIIEVATFRSVGNEEGDLEHSDVGMILRDNSYGGIVEDAIRRDFTVNALYYNIADFSVIDYGGGIADLKSRMLRMLGDPETRYREDPVRILRAIRLAVKLGFSIESETERPIRALVPLLADVPPARVFEEFLKLFMTGTAVDVFEKLRQYGIFSLLFTDTEEALIYEGHDFPLRMVMLGLKNTDLRIAEGKPVTPAFLLAVLLWEPIRHFSQELIHKGTAAYPAMQEAASLVLSRQIQRLSIPKRYSVQMREIWALQSRFHNTRGKRPARLFAHPRFRAAYDFLLLRAEAGEEQQEIADWWTDYQKTHHAATGSSEAQDGKRQRRRHRPKAHHTHGEHGHPRPQDNRH